LSFRVGTIKNDCPTTPVLAELRITQRHLPHWTLEGSIYFVTFDCDAIVLTMEEIRIVVEHIKEGDDKFYDLFAVVVMPDHVHLLHRPLEAHDLSRIMKGIKGVSARKVNFHRETSGTIWQDESYDHIIRDSQEFDQKLNYMYNNPIKKGLTDDPSKYVGWYVNVKKCGFDVLENNG
jgi:REP element-mobilizing transposase RayT